MMRKSLTLAFALAAMMIGVGLPSAAKAELKFCNQTSAKVDVAVGYHTSGDEWVSEGWWGIDPGQCKSPIKESLQGRYYYYYADSSNLTWDGDYVFCTSDQEFTIKGDKDCKSRGYKPEGFREIDVGENISKEIDLTNQ